ncbi:DUF2235 domain-containing protein [Terriglobus aquaticus]|uniref:DUF2235 domain-containing protein n=1 Tax=Terriglobus aquaticus TaxID=940139 RepID=A0ABW9KIL8_9BACT|nr:DUF2235 domain-containing protein [Terriglobus aquaticus]
MSKRIIFCADGTWNTSHGPSLMTADTNVRRFYLSLTEDASQLRYYDSGVGTNGNLAEHLFGGALGEGLFQKVQDGYAFLSNVWDPGDSIYLFGFSRGAYVARSLAGMIAHFGVPTRSFDNQTVPRVFAAYRTRDTAQRALLKEQLQSAYGLQDAEIRMVGVWDTVGALGIPGHLFGTFDALKYGFLDTTLSPCVRSAFHAASIDERRAAFQPTLWTNPDGSPRENDGQVTQIWFPGVHTDVGGGEKEPQLANITLRWMIDKAEECGLTFDEALVQQCYAPMPFQPLGPMHDAWSLIPWGLPVHRTVPACAALSNTTLLRYQRLPSYRPPSLNLPLDRYPTVQVIPESEL